MQYETGKDHGVKPNDRRSARRGAVAASGLDDSRWGRPSEVMVGSGAGARAIEGAYRTVREALQRSRVIDRWSLARNETRSRQLYLVRDEVESERIGWDHAIDVTVYTVSGDVLGQSSFSLMLGEEARIEEKIAEAAQLARGNQVPAYPMPAPATLPKVQTTDREIVAHPRRALETLRGTLVDTVARDRRVHIASAEFFVFHDEAWLENSQGLAADLSGTRSTAEVVLLGRGAGGAEAEVQDLRYRRRAEDLELGSRAAELGESARDATRAEPMKTWTGPVLLRADEVRSFLSPITGQLDGEAVYRKTNRLSIGDPIHEGGFRGDRITVATDRTLPYGRATAPCDGEGVPATRTVVIEDGVVRRYWANARYAHYLNIEPTGSWANLAVPAGSRPVQTLVVGGDVLEVVRFSWFTPSRGTGDFASEMRFGYLHRNGTRVPVKGGAVTGNVFEALGHAYLSREMEFVGMGLVPARMRLEDLKVIGI